MRLYEFKKIRDKSLYVQTCTDPMNSLWNYSVSLHQQVNISQRTAQCMKGFKMVKYIKEDHELNIKDLLTLTACNNVEQ